ncbi:MAG: PA0069 family radical SAM protein [Verrucomicrobiales bacterium]|nr:PA0069 family radical SAM protein [Verrucomicrobiales bacterium]
MADPRLSGSPPRPAGIRGTSLNPAGRFEVLNVEPDPDGDLDPAEQTAQRTQFLRDASVGVISRNNSPDIPFRVSLNPYRGCEHGCAYCYARPTHEYLGYSAGLDFESRIMVKERAAELLRDELSAPDWEPQWLALSGVTDPYQPVERKLGITRRCLEVLAELRHPVGIVTKNATVTRDIDLLGELARHRAVHVSISLTTLDPALRRIMEPRTSPPAARLAAIGKLAAAGIPTGVLTAPVIPGINDHELPQLLKAAREAGASYASYTLLRLPLGVKEIFVDWLVRNFPDRKDKVIHQLEAMRGGNLNDPRFGTRFRGEGGAAQRVSDLFRTVRRRLGLAESGPELAVDAFRRPGGTQMRLFPEA